MPNALDIFRDPAFSLSNLTQAVHELPFVPHQVGDLGVFEEEGVDTLSLMIEAMEGDLALVGESSRGGPGETIANDKRSMRSFVIPHFQRDDTVTADEVQGVRAFGSMTRVETVTSKLLQKVSRHFRDFDMTLEHQRIGAIKGTIQDKSGKIKVDLYKEFGIAAPQIIKMGLDKDETKLRSKCFDIVRSIEDDLETGAYSHIHALVGDDFWKALIEHPQVRETYLNYQAASELRGGIMQQSFEFGGITWERYRMGKKAAARAGASFIAKDEARFFPVGVSGLFITRFAPADLMETVNTIGLPRYMRQYPLPNGKGINVEVQTNPVSLCTKPKVLRRATLGSV